jgi:putative transcriptional regulator
MQYIFDIKQYIYYNVSTSRKQEEKMKKIKTGNRLKLARIEANLTQEELADLIGVTRQTIGLIEANKYNPSLKLCLLLSRYTNTPLGELFWEMEE